MPFTLFHLGPGFGLGLLLRKYLHAPTFIFANVIIDVEPFLVLVFNLNYPLHGYLHTFLLAIPAGLTFGYIMYLLEKLLRPLYKIFLLEASNLNLRSFLAAGALGTGLHLLMDTPLYEDVKPFYPITINPLYKASLALDIYVICIWMGIFGIIYYSGLLGLTLYRKLKNR
jgi:hypothetical protein